MLNPPEVKLNFIDRAFAYFAPVAAARRARARMSLEILGGYTGASTTRRSLKQWRPLGSDADSDILTDLPTLRERSRDLVRNNPIAGGAIKTKVTHVVGTGLRLQARIDRQVLGMTDTQADDWEAHAQREWKLFWESKDCDIARTCTGPDLTRMVYQQAKENGDVFILLPRKKRTGVLYELVLQVIEADRVCNKSNAADDKRLAGGIRKDSNGAPVEYHILNSHPGSVIAGKDENWRVVKAFGEKTGLRNIIHLYRPTRPGQSRGVPDLAPVIETLKQLGRYSEAEIMAAVISGYFTVFIESEGSAATAGFNYSNMDGETGQGGSDPDYKLGNGMIVELNPGDKIHDSNPGRPNSNFDQFVLAVLRQIGTGLEIPFEILIKHFTASYSASRAALLELWKYVVTERQWLADNFLRLVYEVFMWEAVANGRIAAPGFFSDPSVRKAYLGSVWIGPSKGQINELQEVRAAGERLKLKLTTLADETTELTGGDWEINHVQQVKERNKQLTDGLIDQAESGTETGNVQKN